MTNLRDWKSSKFDDYRAKVKAQVAEGIDVNTDTIIDEDTLQEIHDEVAIERFAETVEFDYEIINQNKEKISTGNSVLAFMDRKTNKPTKCPNYILEKFKKSP